MNQPGSKRKLLGSSEIDSHRTSGRLFLLCQHCMFARMFAAAALCFAWSVFVLCVLFVLLRFSALVLVSSCYVGFVIFYAHSSFVT